MIYLAVIILSISLCYTIVALIVRERQNLTPAQYAVSIGITVITSIVCVAAAIDTLLVGNF